MVSGHIPGLRQVAAVTGAGQHQLCGCCWEGRCRTPQTFYLRASSPPRCAGVLAVYIVHHDTSPNAASMSMVCPC